MGMTKREAKGLAVALAKLRPLDEPVGSPIDKLWHEMVDAVAYHLPSNINDAFASACSLHGLWMKEYER